MPALLEDPHAPHHVGPPLPANAHAALQPRTVILRDHVTVASIIPVLAGAGSVPLGLVSVLHEEFNREIERGDTYPMDTPLTLEAFRSYWFGTFAAVMLLGNETALREGRDWANECLGTFYAKPNYPGVSNHICNGSFLVCHNARAKGVGKLLGEAYLDFAPKLGYTYSVFNLVFDTNHASTKIWDSLGFKRIGLVKGAGRLKGHSSPVDAIIYGRELGEDEDYVSEERFDKIRFYLEKGKYPPNADRSEKSRLRSATTHYRLEGNKLLLKDKEVISDGHEQYEIAKRIHGLNHGGINKTTAMIADKYHWVRIKETVSAVIKNCQDCKESARAPVV
ncbi:His(2)-Cys(2) zinc finger-domain-containing protein, partial [Tirmania nivea]